MSKVDQRENFSGVLFDLDGTLADTAPDLAFSLNLSLMDAGYDKVEYSAIRNSASHGSLAMVQTAVPQAQIDKQLEIQQQMLHHYTQQVGLHGGLFSGMNTVLDELDRQSIPYGVVTNKPARFTRPLLDKLGLTHRLASIVSGDSTQHPKPHTAPMLLAAQQIQINPQYILYLGDAERDIIAAHKSDMKSVVALWGYLSHLDDPESWQAHYQLDHPTKILSLFS